MPPQQKNIYLVVPSESHMLSDVRKLPIYKKIKKFIDTHTHIYTHLKTILTYKHTHTHSYSHKNASHDGNQNLK